QKQEGNVDLPKLAQQNVKEGATFKMSSVYKSNKAVIEKFFTSLETLDIPAFLSTWAENGKQLMPLSPDNVPHELNGKDAIYNQYKALPENYTSMQFPRRYFPTDDPNTVIVQYNGIIPLKEGGEYNNNYVGIFKIGAGKLLQFVEYFDPFILQEAFGKKLESSFNVENGKTSSIKVQFKSEGLILKGLLHLPSNFDDTKKFKAVVVTGSWTTVKEQMPNLYAAKLAALGIMALTFDFRNYGESEGQPRNYEVPEMKAEDIINAVAYLKSLPFVEKDEIGGLAVCASSGYMIEAVAKGADIKALTLVAPWLHNQSIVKEIYGGAEGVSHKIDLGKKAKKQFAETGKVEYVPAISTTDSSAAMLGQFDYYLNNKRGAIKQWGNQFAVMAWQGWLEYDPIQLASKINIPVLIVHSKTAAIPQGAEMFYNNLKGSKNIIWVDKAIQFDFYDQEPYTTNAAGEAMKWYHHYLN
ncbi:MAG TPA: nuclear transport factor 2 family protein, partial [Chitinophagaceae bacterium]|nr:nuclear transport factor 2 family protein [Chitinophagaceae bacterium]